MGRRLAVLGVMAALIVLMFWAGVHNLRHRREVAQSNRITLIPASPADGSAAPEAQGAELRGKPAPAFTLIDLNGKKVSLADYKGHPVVVNFWATWCGPCKLEMPWFQEFSAKYQNQGLEVLGLSQDDGATTNDIAEAAKRIGVSYPILMPDEKVAKKYGGVDYLPETFYIDRDGKVVEVTAGAPSKEHMEALIQKAIAAQGGA
ncbi:MAG TPA: TlpA disulfide reductase family protein [Acidobacteriaceae bacterium]|nr:TlpA disulfide reductase family protein [Acidobacteriaceae bacterium]